MSEERYFKFENLMAPRTQALYSSEEPITEQRVKALAEELLRENR